VAPVLYVPSVRLHQADDAIRLWETTESAEAAPMPPPFWAFPWAGGQALARHLLDHPGTVAGRSVFDLAAGSGLVAVAAALAGGRVVTANEIDPYAAAAIAMNAALNGVDVAVVEGDLLDTDVDADVVLAGDVFYRKPMADRVLPFLRRALHRGTRVLVGDPGRAYLPRDGLVRLAEYDVPVTAELEDADVKRTVIWELRTT
jgi:predicted nicotinamide N-methyase